MRSLIEFLLACATGGCALLLFHPSQPAIPPTEISRAPVFTDVPAPHVSDPPVPSAPEARLDWESIESEDWRVLIANLRRVNCPERTISDIVYGRVRFTYQRRINQAANPLLKYWGSAAELQEADARKQSLVGEREVLLASLGLRRPFDPNAVDPFRPPSKTAELPPEKQQRIAEITRLHPIVQPALDATPGERAAFFNERRARIDYLKNYLTPEELFNYRVERDSNARAVFLAVRDLDLNDGELRRICFALDFCEPIRVNGLLNEAAEATIREVLGPERYQVYLDTHSPKNHYFETYALRMRLGPDTANQLRAIRAKALPPEDYRNAIQGVLGVEKMADYMRMVHPE